MKLVGAGAFILEKNRKQLPAVRPGSWSYCDGTVYVKYSLTRLKPISLDVKRRLQLQTLYSR